jgi:hypothetical protein
MAYFEISRNTLHLHRVAGLAAVIQTGRILNVRHYIDIFSSHILVNSNACTCLTIFKYKLELRSSEK